MNKNPVLSETLLSISEELSKNRKNISPENINNTSQQINECTNNNKLPKEFVYIFYITLLISVLFCILWFFMIYFKPKFDANNFK